ncbi:phage shock protein C, PspC [Methanosalsum zhilinae DSM 4017]|uniref:Phage shock protein C, PspC n=1 Tax=Methanosalsum zhilinae (strain DSM 4017 / NBRC 107636 / OCM 62 / WeN5) TaxID=679901 RepID=F7XLC6_METZD|nr:PspC domain-containing protein [Methanosalsum zhilinae]AEH60784.1 phage shock protein C, PspC [Methanosalsum zhilinae DSM 4017]
MNNDETSINENKPKKLTRSKEDRMIAGVCGGIANYFDVDSTLVRILYVIFTLVTAVGVGILLYIVLALVIPEEDIEQ